VPRGRVPVRVGGRCRGRLRAERDARKAAVQVV
jgi:hypothetical protein